ECVENAGVGVHGPDRGALLEKQLPDRFADLHAPHLLIEFRHCSGAALFRYAPLARCRPTVRSFERSRYRAQQAKQPTMRYYEWQMRVAVTSSQLRGAPSAYG